MKHERLIFWILLTLFAFAIFVHTVDKDWGFIITASIVLFCLIQQSRLVKKMKVITYTVGTSINDLSGLVSWAQEFVYSTQVRHRALLTALHRIGYDNQSEQSDELIDPETLKALQNLKEKLQVIKLEEQRRVWIAQGVALLSEIRKNNSELAEYSYEVISRLVKYLQANQGSFYIIQQENGCEHLELFATYAYGKRKYTNEKIIIEAGAGQVGQCVLDRELILLTDVPNDYMRITSGLGEALPRCIIIVPLIFRSAVYGVIEMAAFQKFTPYEIELIKKVCEIIAIELSSIRAQQETKAMLEQSQEAELRKNLEEMRATQLEMVRKEEELSQQLLSTQQAKAMAEAERIKNEAILEGCMDAVISFNESGAIEYFNKAAEEMFGYAREKMIGSHAEQILAIHIVENEHGTVTIRSVKGKEVTIRTEINASDVNGEEITLLLTATKVKINKHFLFTLFAQKVSVDLF